MTRFFSTLALLGLFLAPTSAQAEDVYWTTKGLLKDFFKSSKQVSYVKVDTAAARKELQAKLGYVPSKATYVIFVARTGSNIDGYAVIDAQQGQHQPITFGVKLSPKGRVERLEVMVYREGHGDEIKERRFRGQFTNKGEDDSLKLGSDIMAISGATISSRSMSMGVRRAVALVGVVRASQTADAHASSAGTRRAP